MQYKVRFIGITLAGLILSLVGCGGASAPGSSAGPATVVSITPDRLMYSRTTKFTVMGLNLDQGTSLRAPQCSGIAEVVGGTESQRVFSCSPVATGPIAVSVLNPAGSILATINPTVPLPRITIQIPEGDLVLELYPANAPITVNNFLQYVADNFYTDLIFDKVITGYMVQGGSFNRQLQVVATRSPIKLESHNGLSNLRGTIAMARSPAPDSATSEFYINLADNVGLDTADGGYAVFGKLIVGFAALEELGNEQTASSRGFDYLPITGLVISSVVQTQ